MVRRIAVALILALTLTPAGVAAASGKNMESDSAGISMENIGEASAGVKELLKDYEGVELKGESIKIKSKSGDADFTIKYDTKSLANVGSKALQPSENKTWDLLKYCFIGGIVLGFFNILLRTVHNLRRTIAGFIPRRRDDLPEES